MHAQKKITVEDKLNMPYETFVKLMILISKTSVSFSTITDK